LTTCSSRENKSARYQTGEKFNQLISEQRDILVKNEFDRIYAGRRGQMNGLHLEDMTAYSVNAR